MKTIIVDHDNGEVKPENKIRPWADDFINSEQDEITVGCLLFVDYVRLMIRAEKLKPSDIKLMFKDDEISINGVGQLERWPDGFGDHTMKVMAAFMTGKPIAD